MAVIPDKHGRFGAYGGRYVPETLIRITSYNVCYTKLLRIIVLLAGGLMLSGCVLNEKYEAEKARSLNFQRLLAQEEKRTGELDSEVKRTKQELAEYETRNRELTAQVQALREQMGHLQEEADAISYNFV